MRTTIMLSDDLYRDVRASAASRGRTVTSFIEDALRAELRRLAEPPDREPYVIEPFHGDGLMPGVDLDDNSALLDLMDADERP